MTPGTRVIVDIKDPERYAMGAAASLNGKTGKVVEWWRPHDDGKVLVEFDTPAEKWWSNQMPVEAFWFRTSELRSEP